jgi:CDGSH-type Zn-finger protein/uncharacterized Fe-S cluster protein YjdI
MSKLEEVRGQKVLLRFEGSRCIHARHCVLGRPDVFVPNVEGEWIHPDRATPEEIAELAHNCPSGAISFQRLDGGDNEAPPVVNVLRVRENGPLAIGAPVQIDGVAVGLRVTLCRCGASKNKPYCDGSHAAAGFQASGEPATQQSTPLGARNGTLAVTPQPNGPLLVQGNLEICSGTGRTVNRVTKAALCRCGSSQNKPLCDGSHKRVGFRTD